MTRERASTNSKCPDGPGDEAGGAAPAGHGSPLERVYRHLPLAFIVVAGLLAYSNSFRGEFAFDDHEQLVENPLLRSLHNYLSSPSGYRAVPNRYLTYLTFALNYRLGGLDVAGYHVVNVAIHILNALLVFALVRLSFRTPHLSRSRLRPWSRQVAFVAALLFVVHPIQTQAVTYIVQRLTSLATFFYLLTVVQYARWRLAREPGRVRPARAVAVYVPILLTAILAMKSKEIAFTLPVVVTLYEVFFFQAGWTRRVVYLAPLLATLLIIPLTMLTLDKPVAEILSDVTESARLETAMSRMDYLRTQLAVIATYLRLLVLPVNQNLDYDYPVYRSFLDPGLLLSLLLLLSVAAVALLLYGGPIGRWTKRVPDPAARLASFGIVWFFVALSVESSVIPIVDVIFEHRMYLPSVGMLVAAATIWFLVAHRLAPDRPRLPSAVSVVLAAILGLATMHRNEVWASEVSLWRDVVQKSPGKARPHNNLGRALGRLHKEQEALPHFLSAIRNDPNSFRAHNNLGVALAKLGRQTEAMEAFRTAVRLNPRHAEAYYNIGRLYLMREGWLQDAAMMFEKAIEIRPFYPNAHVNLAAAWNGLGRHADTVRLLKGSHEIVRNHPVAHYHLAVAYFFLGDRPATQRELEILEALSPALATNLLDIIQKRGAGQE